MKARICLKGMSMEAMSARVHVHSQVWHLVDVAARQRVSLPSFAPLIARSERR
jgi:hypothetical protein